MKTARTLNLDQGWKFSTGMYNSLSEFLAAAKPELAGKPLRQVNLPHDYMMEAGPDPKAPAGSASGFYTAGPAHYTRQVEIPAGWEGEEVYLQLDGAMMNATVEVNGCRAALQHNGYIPFAVRITPYLYCGQANRITITLNPAMQPNSRWYTGAGLLRSVSLLHVSPLHLEPDGIFGITRSIDYGPDGQPESAQLEVAVDLRNRTGLPRVASVEVWLTREDTGAEAARCVQPLQVEPDSLATAHLRFSLPWPLLWNAEHPNLYRLHARMTECGSFRTHLIPADQPMVDEAEVLFGVRTIQVDAEHGLRINGRTVKLRGGCLHHDNGIAGAISLYDLEARKLARMKEIGYNAIRTAHNPPSAALIEACDRLGVYVLDEAFDAWGMMKQPGDYNQFFDTDWQKDLAAFVRRDRSHPAVILWSTGNEIPERGGLNHGYALATQLAEAVRALDPTRPVTNALCSYWNGLDEQLTRQTMVKLLASGTGAVQNAQTDTEEDTTWEQYSAPFVNGLDVVGYNYMEDKYQLDHRLYPHRVMLGTETYPKEIGLHWPMVETLPYLVGDFTWTAWDYLGEAGLGKGMFLVPGDPAAALAEYQLSSWSSPYPWRLANGADLDLTGCPTPQGDYRSVVWGSRRTFLFSYDPAVTDQEEFLSRWGFPAVRRCWNWPGAQGQQVRVAVFSAAPEVVLFCNGREVGRQKAGDALLAGMPHTFVFVLPYSAGRLDAVSLEGGQEVSRAMLETTGPAAALRLHAEAESLTADGHSVLCVQVEVVDREGRLVPDATLPLQAAVTGEAVLAGFGSANPITEENYTTGQFHSYQGRALAVLRSGYQAGNAVLTVRCEGLEEGSLTLSLTPAILPRL